MADWLLIETFGGNRGPTVMAQGNSPRGMVPLEKFLRRGRDVDAVRAVIEQVAATGTDVDTTTRDGSRRLIAHPLMSYDGKMHGLFVWVGRHDDDPPPRDPAGAWFVNLTRYLSVRSDELLVGVYGAVPDNRVNVVNLSELFSGKTAAGDYGRLQTNTDEAGALAKLINTKPGDEHQATWTVTRDDGGKRAGNFAFRTIAEPNEDGEIEFIGRGITHDIGSAETSPAAPPQQPILLAELVLDAERTPGEWRAIVKLETLTLLRWYQDPMPGVAWERNGPYKPAIHRADLRRAKAMSEQLGRGGHVRSVLRLRGRDGGWLRVNVDARLMLLNQHTTAGYVVLSVADETE